MQGNGSLSQIHGGVNKLQFSSRRYFVFPNFHPSSHLEYYFIHLPPLIWCKMQPRSHLRYSIIGWAPQTQ
jgi:hypothetical protein